MSMLYIKTKFEININNDELLETIWEHTMGVKRGEGGLLN
jgi:HD superfamily phosphohydrolase YqeK